MSERNIVIIQHWERMLKCNPRFLEIHCTRSGRPWNSIWPSRCTRLRDGRRSGTTQTENIVRHMKYGRIRGWSLVRVVVRQEFYCTTNIKLSILRKIISVPHILDNCILNKTGHLHIICKMHIIMFKCRFLDQCTVKNTYIAREKHVHAGGRVG